LVCPHCGNDTPAPEGRCTICNGQIDRLVAVGGLTPIVQNRLPPAEVSAIEPADPDETRLDTRAPALRNHVEPTMMVPGAAFGPRYRILRVLGYGGMGVVYEGHSARGHG
jgi:hypothetical protein